MGGFKGVLLLVLSGMVGLAAVSMFGQQKRVMARDIAPPSAIVIAAEDVPMGQVLDKSMIRTIEWPAEIQPKGGFQTVDELIGRVVNTMLSRGEPLLESKLAPKGNRALTAAKVSKTQESVEVIRGVQRTNKAL